MGCQTSKQQQMYKYQSTKDHAHKVQSLRSIPDERQSKSLQKKLKSKQQLQYFQQAVIQNSDNKTTKNFISHEISRNDLSNNGKKLSTKEEIVLNQKYGINQERFFKRPSESAYWINPSQDIVISWICEDNNNDYFPHEDSFGQNMNENNDYLGQKDTSLFKDQDEFEYIINYTDRENIPVQNHANNIQQTVDHVQNGNIQAELYTISESQRYMSSQNENKHSIFIPKFRSQNFSRQKSIESEDNNKSQQSNTKSFTIMQCLEKRIEKRSIALVQAN